MPDGIGTLYPYVKTFAIEPFAEPMAAQPRILAAEQPVRLRRVPCMASYPFDELTVAFPVIGEGAELTVSELLETNGVNDGRIEFFLGKIYADK